MKESNPSLFGSQEFERVFSVSELLDYLNALIGQEEVFVQGEVTGTSVHPSGVYFSMKDEDDESILNCYLNPRIYHALGITIQDGLRVKVSGMAQVYKAKGRLSMQVRTLELAGEGSLKKAYDELKKKLEAEGLFERKRPLPEFISRIGVITSRTGAVIDDFRKNLSALGLRVSLYDARVEGAKAVPQILKGIEWFQRNAASFDILVVMRGGGSLEDLQAFNNERIVRELFACKLPTICGIGHDRDVPIASLTADAMTSTPTAAAHLVNQSWSRLTSDVALAQQNIFRSFEESLVNSQGFVTQTARQLVNQIKHITTAYEYFQKQLGQFFQMLAERVQFIRERSLQLRENLLRSAEQNVVTYQQKIKSYELYLAGVSPEHNLRLGYSIVFDAKGHIIRSVQKVAPGQRITAHLHEGKVTADVVKVDK